MPVYYGKDHEVRVGTTEAGCSASAALPWFRRAEWKVDPNIQRVPVGFGSNLKEPHATLLDYTGTIEFEVDETHIGQGTEEAALTFEADVTGSRTPLYIEIKNIVTGAKVMLKECLGSYNESIPDVDGIKHGTYDFSFSTVAFSYP